MGGAPHAEGAQGPATLKASGDSSDPSGMARNEVCCPICEVDIPLSGDEKSGEEIYCTVCGAPIILKGDPQGDDLELEPDI